MDTVTGAAKPAIVREGDDLAVMTMLQEHVPLSLLIDLTAPDGPSSAEILAEEGAPETAWWLP